MAVHMLARRDILRGMADDLPEFQDRLALGHGGACDLVPARDALFQRCADAERVCPGGQARRAAGRRYRRGAGSGSAIGVDLFQRTDHAAQFRKPAHPADQRIAGDSCPIHIRQEDHARDRGGTGSRRDPAPIGAASRFLFDQNADSATMSVSPSRCAASSKDPSGSLRTLRRWAKWMRRRSARRWQARHWPDWPPESPSRASARSPGCPPQP